MYRLGRPSVYGEHVSSRTLDILADVLGIIFQAPITRTVLNIFRQNSTTIFRHNSPTIPSQLHYHSCIMII